MKVYHAKKLSYVDKMKVVIGSSIGDNNFY